MFFIPALAPDYAAAHSEYKAAVTDALPSGVGKAYRDKK
jgi:hypothetical protein